MSNFSSKESTHRIILQGAQLLILLSFFTPMIVVTSSFIFPFVVPRVLFFRIVISLALLAYVLLLLIDWDRYKPKKDLISLTVLVFFTSLFLSTIFSRDIQRSLWDNHERMLGFYTLLHYGFLYFIAQNVFRRWKEWRMVWWVFMVVSIPVFVVGIHQIFDAGYLLNRDASRIASTLGNPIYVSAHAIFVFMLSIYMILRERLIGLRVFAGIIGVLAFINFLASNTRGTSLGFIAAVGVVPLAIVLFKRDSKRLRSAMLVAVAVAVVGLGVLYRYREIPVIYKTPVIGRVLNIKLEGTTAETRFIAWDIAVKAWKERPILGWGPVNYYYAFNKYYNPRSYLHGLEETWFDNAHSMIFNTLTERGIIGLVAYLLLYLSTVMVMFKKRYSENGMIIFLFGLGFLTTHFIHNIIAFENVTSYIYFFLFLAFVSSFSTYSEDEKEDGSTKKVLPLGSSIAAVAVVSFMIFVWNVQVARANRGTFRTLQQFSFGLEAGMNSFRKVLQIPTPHIEDVRSDVSASVFRSIKRPQTPAEVDYLKQELLFLREELEKTTKVHDAEIRVHMRIATVDRALAVVTQDPKYLIHADEVFAEAMKYSPRRQQLFYERASNALLLKQGDVAIAYLKKAVELEPELVHSYVQLAQAQHTSEKYDDAAETIFEALGRKLRMRNEAEMDNTAKIITDSSFTLDAIMERMDILEENDEAHLDKVRSEMYKQFREKIVFFENKGAEEEK